MITSVLLHCVQRCVESDGEGGGQTIERLLLFLIFHCAKDDDHSKAMKDLGAAFSCTSNHLSFIYFGGSCCNFFGELRRISGVKSADCELSKVSITACLTVRLFMWTHQRRLVSSVRDLIFFHFQLLWQYGDRHYQANRWDIAVDWFLGGTHQLFRSFSEGTMKCYRKAALCYIQQREYASAAAVVRLCPGNEAATHYISLLTSVKQGIYHILCPRGRFHHTPYGSNQI